MAPLKVHIDKIYRNHSFISILRLGCCPCPIRWVWQYLAIFLFAIHVFDLAYLNLIQLIIPSAQRSCWGHIGFTPSARPCGRPACRVRSVTPVVLDGIFNSMRGCVACNDLWPWLISSRPFSHEFAIKLLKYGISCRVHFTAHTVLDGFFPY